MSAPNGFGRIEMFTNEHVFGATPLDPDEKAGLKFPHITTRGQLDELEQANILQGMIWLNSQSSENMLTQEFMRQFHNKLFGDVWAWAGKYRKTEKNIGIDPFQISVSLENLINDALAWIEFGIYNPIEAVLRLHHQLVKIHPFPNGNGRFSRLYADAIGGNFFNVQPIKWGGRQLDNTSKTRTLYIEALRAADGGDMASLLKLYGSDNN